MAVVSVTSSAQGPAGSAAYQLQQGLPKQIPIRPGGEVETPLLRAREEALKPEFLDLVKGFVGDVNAQQARAGRAVEAFVAGEITDLHQVMVAMQEAGIALDLLIEVRNRVQEAFQEVMRMQV